ncbi:MAG: hypothetical protein DRI69_05900 [Bacteroidetes bacterium]|nr:MAG: hypothetical protein DRI69_05900 [Bacteroidota bacterium]
MIHKEPESPWWLVCANLVEDENVSADYWSKWASSIDIEDISGQELTLATHLFSKWRESDTMDFDPRIRGNAKRTFFVGAKYARAIEEIDRVMLDKGIAHAWLRESGMSSGNFGSGQFLPVHKLEMLINARLEWKANEVLSSLGWSEKESTRTAVVYSNQDNLELCLFYEINPHWTQDMHDDLQTCISQEASGVSLLLDLLSQIQLERESVDWLRILESMLLLRHLATIDKWETLIKGARDYLVLEPLMKVYRHFIEVFPEYSHIQIQVPGVELRLHAAYGDYMSSRSLPDKVRYHLARYRAINSVSEGLVSPLNYVLATRSSRKERRT